MLSNIYAIYDVKSGMYGPAMTFVNDATAIRSFQEMLTSQDQNSLLSLYPADYILFCVGEYNQETGLIKSHAAPVNIIAGMQAFTNACNDAEARRKRAKLLQGKYDDQCDYDGAPISNSDMFDAKICKNAVSVAKKMKSVSESKS